VAGAKRGDACNYRNRIRGRAVGETSADLVGSPLRHEIGFKSFQTDFRCISCDEDGPHVKPFSWQPMEAPPPKRKGTGT